MKINEELEREALTRISARHRLPVDGLDNWAMACQIAQYDYGRLTSEQKEEARRYSALF